MIMKLQAKFSFPGGIFDYIIIVKGHMKGWEGEKQEGEFQWVTECGRVLAFQSQGPKFDPSLGHIYKIVLH